MCLYLIILCITFIALVLKNVQGKKITNKSINENDIKQILHDNKLILYFKVNKFQSLTKQQNELPKKLKIKDKSIVV